MTTTSGGTYCLIDLMRCAVKQSLALALLLIPVLSFAQTSDELFRGTWQVESPEKGALVILLKSQGRASYFWGDNTDRTVYEGNWTHTGSSATINWQDGSSHIIERGTAGFTASAKSASGQTLYSSAAKQIPQEMLGQWAKPPTREDKMRSDRDKAKGFFGNWRLGKSDDFLFIEPDRSAASNIGDGGGQRGEWAKQGSELHIIWDSGHYGILSETARGHEYKLIEPGQIIEEDTSETVAATRTIESNVPQKWLSKYKAERENDPGGLAFSSRKVARSFYRGNWLVRRGEKNFERIDLARFGGLSSSKDSSLGGDWTLSGQDVFMRWDNGVRKIISPVGRSFVMYEYKPGRPLDGVPTRVLPAVPEDSEKLAEHLKGRADVARQLQEMAEAAGIDPDSQEEAGWGRTFARWAWPFGDEGEAKSAEEMLAEEFEPDASADPWWWPFWSENAPEVENESDSSSEESSDPAEKTETEVPTESSDAEATAEPAEPKAPIKEAAPKSRTNKDWLWPF